MTLLASQTSPTFTAQCAGDTSRWAVNAVGLGVTDILMAQVFVAASRMSSTVSIACSAAISDASAALCGHVLEPPSVSSIGIVLRNLAAAFGAAAQTCVARAA
jgi:hypothetical protein